MMTLMQFITLFREWDKFIVIAPSVTGQPFTLELTRSCFEAGIYDGNFLNLVIGSITKNSKGVTIMLA